MRRPGPVLRRSVELIGMLEHAPALPKLGPSPSEWVRTPRRRSGGGSSPQEARLLARVRALLTKAESTPFPEEAESLTAKAQELMARHAISERLRQTVGAEVDAGAARHGQGLLPVLARRVQAVDAAVDAAFPGMTERVLRTSNGFGCAAGRAAADLADLAVGEGLGKPA